MKDAIREIISNNWKNFKDPITITEIGQQLASASRLTVDLGEVRVVLDQLKSDGVISEVKPGAFVPLCAETTSGGIVMKSLLCAALCFSSLLIATAATVSDVTARQRYPWNGLVDINFTITGDAGTKYDTSFTAKDMVGNTNIAMKTIRKADGTAATATEQLLPGNYKWVWNAAADLPDGFQCERVTVAATADEWNPLYMVVDLSTGEKSYLADVPDGGWTDEYKTSKMVLRKIFKGTNPAGGSMTNDMWVGVFEFTQGQANALGIKDGAGSVSGTVFSGQEGGLGVLKPVNCSKVFYNGSYYSNAGEKQPATDINGEVIYYSASTAARTVNVPFIVSRFKEATGLTATRLPSAVEWQYAYRAGTTTDYYAYPVSDIATCGAAELSNVGMHKPNAWGLYDMSGNAGEMTSCYWIGQYASWQVCYGGTFRCKESDCMVTSNGWPEYCLNISTGPHYHTNACRIFIDAE